jgi:M6 family metalloprotease-like protein
MMRYLKKMYLSAAALCMLSMGGLNLQAAPYHNVSMSLLQPNGDSVKVVVSGDEFFQHVETPDGFTLVRDPQTGWICFATLNSDSSELISTGRIYGATSVSPLGSAGSGPNPGTGLTKGVEIKSSARIQKVQRVKKERGLTVPRLESISPDGAASSSPNSSYAPAPVNGAVRGLTLLIDFSDQPSYISREQIDNFCNQVGYNGFGNNGSVYDYYFDVSDGRLQYANTVTEYYRAQHPKTYYDTLNHFERVSELITEALNALDDQGFDFSTLSTSNEGQIKAINILYAGTPSWGWAIGLWPHMSYLYPQFSADNVHSGPYQITNIGGALGLNTFCHENGHMVMSWPDLYDYGFESKGTGVYCLMSGGGSAEDPVPPCPYLRWLAGWEEVIDLPNNPTQAVSYTVTANSHRCYKYANPQAANEFFLIENRIQTQRDATLPSKGLAIWHVDENGSNNYEQMTPALHYKVSLEQADRNFDLEAAYGGWGDSEDLYPQPANSLFNDYSIPNAKWWSRQPSGLNITAIGPAGIEQSFILETPAVDIQRKWAFEDFNNDGYWNQSVTWQSGGSTITTGADGALPIERTLVYEGAGSLKFAIKHNGTGSAGGAITTSATPDGIEPTSLADRDAGKNLSAYEQLQFFMLGEGNSGFDLTVELQDASGRVSGAVKLSEVTRHYSRAWHGVVIPLAKFSGKTFDITAVTRINFRVSANQPAFQGTLWFDNISFVSNRYGQANQAPAASAGADQSVAVNAKVTLDGSGSSDPDNSPHALTYGWTQLSGPTVTLTTPTAAQASFTPTVTGAYTFRLTVSDGEASSSDEVTINAAIITNLLTNGDFSNSGASWIAKFTAPATGGVTYTTGTAKVVINTKGTLNWHVQLYQLIPVTAATAYNYSFSARKLSTGTRDITFMVETDATPYTKDIERPVTIDGNWQKVTGSFTASSGRVVRIEIQAGLSDLDFELDNFVVVPATTVNLPPAANAGLDRSVAVNTQVTLDGRGSSDPDNGPSALTYSWTQVGGAVVTLTNPTAAQPLFTPVAAGVYTFRLTVNDGAASAGDEVVITVTGVSPNLLSNPDFANGAASWTAKMTAPATGSIAMTTGAAKFTIDKAGALNWHAQLYQAIPVTAGAVYNYSFTAKKSSAGTRTINFVVETDATPYTKDKDLPITIDGTAKTYSGTFTASSSRSVRIEIQGGLSDLDFEVDDFVVTKQ